MTITANLRMLVCPRQTPETARQRPATGPNDVPVHPRCWLLTSAIDIYRLQVAPNDPALPIAIWDSPGIPKNIVDVPLYTK